jgi:hypothetical protein
MMTSVIPTVNVWMKNVKADYRLGCISEALVVAAKHGRVEVVKVLMKEDGIAWPCYMQAYDLAAENNHEAVQQLFTYPWFEGSG